MFPPRQQMQPKPKLKKQSDDCIIDVKKTKTGKRITIKGKCSREKVEAARDLDRD